ncbi:hypothetical protein OQA88_4847 [Cercophora sp. LCS_1]
MKGFACLAALSLAVSDVSAHYIFQQLSSGGTKNPLWKYVRQHSNYNSPVTALTSNDLRCNVGGGSGGSTETLDVQAGASFTFHTDVAVYHQGPTAIYMSKAPGSAASYDGSGGWFKVQQWGANFGGGSQWTLSDAYTFTIPSCIAPGEYLLRIEQLGIHNPYPAGTPQFYISCAQIRVSGGGSASPATVSIPGHVKESDPGYTVNIYTNFNSYTVPGPAPFTCSGSNTPSNPNPNPGTPATTLTTSTVATQPTATAPASCAAAKWAQCGGIGFSGCTTCASGSTCNRVNEYYSQCA